MYCRSTYQSPIGCFAFVFDNDCLIAVELPNSDLKPWLEKNTGAAGLPERALSPAMKKTLDGYFLHAQALVWPGELKLIGTPFQVRVWNEIQSIPIGATRTYGELAAALNTRGFRAVGQAVGKNPIPLLIPCHRVVAAAGMGGFSGDPLLKKFLLEWERPLEKQPGWA